VIARLGKSQRGGTPDARIGTSNNGSWGTHGLDGSCYKVHRADPELVQILVTGTAYPAVRCLWRIDGC
jgi:hypothetical protein